MRMRLADRGGDCPPAHAQSIPGGFPAGLSTRLPLRSFPLTSRGGRRKQSHRDLQHSSQEDCQRFDGAGLGLAPFCAQQAPGRGAWWASDAHSSLSEATDTETDPLEPAGECTHTEKNKYVAAVGESTATVVVETTPTTHLALPSHNVQIMPGRARCLAALAALVVLMAIGTAAEKRRNLLYVIFDDLVGLGLPPAGHIAPPTTPILLLHSGPTSDHTDARTSTRRTSTRLLPRAFSSATPLPSRRSAGS